MTLYWGLNLTMATMNAEDEFLIAVPKPRTGFVFSDGPPTTIMRFEICDSKEI